MEICPACDEISDKGAEDKIINKKSEQLKFRLGQKLKRPLPENDEPPNFRDVF
jgi:hypothetical protein